MLGLLQACAQAIASGSAKPADAQLRAQELQVRAEVLRLLFADASRELHLRDLTRQSGLGLGTVQGELEKLLGADLVTSRRDGNRRYYRANSSHPLFPDLQQLVLKTTGLRDMLEEALRGIKGVEVAFAFGSLAPGAGKAASDVDLFVIGDVGLRTLAPALRRAVDAVGREINPVSMTAAEFRKRRAKDPFVLDVLGKEKLFVKGGADELERAGNGEGRMKVAKKRRLEAAGLKVGSAEEFLGLSAAESAAASLRLASVEKVRRTRTATMSWPIMAYHFPESGKAQDRISP